MPRPEYRGAIVRHDIDHTTGRGSRARIARTSWLVFVLLLLTASLAHAQALPAQIGLVRTRLLWLALATAGAGLLLALTPLGAKWRWLLPAGLLLSFGLVFRYGLIDDAYISLRYARNLAGGLGPSFNPGDRVEGYTSFLWVWGMAAIHALTRLPLERLSVALSVGSALLLLVALGRLVRRAGGAADDGVSSALLLAAYLPLVFWGFSGMETPLFVALLLLVATRLARLGPSSPTSEAVRAGILLGVATAVRPEGCAYLAASAGVLAIRSRRSVVPLVASAIGVLLPEVLFRWFYYRDILPNTFYVKVDYSSLTLARHGLAYLKEGAAPHLAVAASAALGAGVLTRRRAWEPHSTLAAVFVATGVLVAVYTGGDHFRELRFYLPILPFLVVLGASAWREFRRPWSAIAPTAVAIVTLVASVEHRALGATSSLVFGPAITARWRAAGEWLHRTASPTDLLATPVAGAIPYASELRTIDMLGLNDRVIGRKRVRLGLGDRDHEKFDAVYVLSRRPDWIFLGHFAAADLPDAARRCAALPVYRDLFQHLDASEYELVTDRSTEAAWSFLRRRK